MQIEDFKDPKGQPPAEDVLVLVLIEGRWGLRSLHDGDWYDENEIYDDSGLEVTGWHHLPKQPGPC